MIGLYQQGKSHASSRSFGGLVWAHFPEQRLVIEPNEKAEKQRKIYFYHNTLLPKSQQTNYLTF